MKCICMDDGDNTYIWHSSNGENIHREVKIGTTASLEVKRFRDALSTLEDTLWVSGFLAADMLKDLTFDILVLAIAATIVDALSEIGATLNDSLRIVGVHAFPVLAEFEVREANTTNNWHFVTPERLHEFLIVARHGFVRST